MSETNNEMLQLDDLLDDLLDDIVDLPEFCTPPNGTYLLFIDKVEAKMIADKPAVQFLCKVEDTLELANPEKDEDNKVTPGSLWATAYFPLASEDSKAYMKRDLAGMREATGASKLSEVAANMQGMNVIATIKQRKLEKNGETKIYASWSNVMPAS